MSSKESPATPYERLGAHDSRSHWKVLGLCVGFCASVLACGMVANRRSSAVSLRAVASDGSDADRVWSVPGAPALLQVHRAGYVPVSEAARNYLFYYFVESKRVEKGDAQDEIPLVIWLNGGPGASSMTGMVIEGVGPLILNDDGLTLRTHDFGFDQVAHVLAWDPSAGSGYSYSERGPAGYVHGMAAMGDQLLEGMLQFYKRHPQYAKSKVYIVGESFAGKIIPFFCTAIRNANKAAGHELVPLTGFAIGNGVFKGLMQYTSILDVASTLGYAGKHELARARGWLENCKTYLSADQPDWQKAYEACQKVEDDMYLRTDLFVYDMRDETPKFANVNAYMTSYFNSPIVRKALNVFPHGWVQLDGGMVGNIPSELLWKPQINDVPAGMLESLITDYQSLFYAGNMDLSSCNPLGVSRVLASLEWPGAAAFNNASKCVWNMNGHGAGVTQRGGGLTWLVLLNSGHLVPMSQPRRALEMVRLFLERKTDQMCTPFAA